ncbi:MAG: hypothetical protein C5B53_04980 [Candidatus Melainabacteria bacterium]|nr:MAG: hypothetical protein C5B53_04980 [Candidatus Melainabacteria bacterium]
MKTSLFLYGMTFLFLIKPADAQQPDLNKLLDSVDRPSGWAKTPVSNSNQSGQFASKEFMHHHDPSLPRNQIVQPMGDPANMNAGTQWQQAGQAAGPFIRQQVLKSFLNGSGSQPANNAAQPAQSKSFSGSTAYSDWQRAENEAIRARNYASKARYDQNQWNRKDSANSANYAANAARQASDRVYYASLNGDPTAKQYASKAKAAADRARADANRARYNADTIR